MEEVVEFTARIRREGDRFRITCPQIGISITSTDQMEAIEIMKKWTYALVDSLIIKDLSNT